MPTDKAPFGAEKFDTGVPVSQPDSDDSGEQDPRHLVGRMIEEALQWRSENLDPDLEKATDYYKAEPFGNEEEGRSQVVDTAVRDVVQGIMPQLLRIFFGPEEVVEFEPDHPERVDLAKAMTEQVNYVIKEENEGFTAFYSMLKDALIRKLGVVKYWWDESIETHESEHSGMTAQQVAFLEAQDDIEVEIVERPDEGEDDEQEAAQTGEQTATPPTFTIRVTRTEDDGRVQIAPIPPEEFVWSPNARSLEDARMVGHVRDVPASELVAMGVSREQVERHRGGHATNDEPQSSDTLQAARRIEGHVPADDEQDESTQDVPFGEIYVKLDLDDDGVAELHKVWVIGDNWEWAVDEDGEEFDEIVDERPFALFGPDPEPHSFIGQSIAEYVMDLQEINSALERGMLDSLYQHIRPSQEVVEGKVNIADLKNPEVGRFVRVEQPGMIREIETDFVGKQVLPVLQHTEEMKQNRTGISKAAEGLDADALQSSTRAAVEATIGAAQARIEMIARVLAETGMKQLMNGVAGLLAQHQDRRRMVRISGEFVEMDPRSWDLDLNLTVSVGLGNGMTDQKIQALQLVLQEQKELLQAGAPIVGFREYRNTLAKLTKLAGFERETDFWKPFGKQEERAFQKQQQQQAQQPSVEERLAQIEAAKVRQKEAESQREYELEKLKLRLEDDRKRDEIVRDFTAKLLDLGVEVEEQKLQAAREALDADLEIREQDRADVEATLGALESLSDIELEIEEGEGRPPTPGRIPTPDRRPTPELSPTTGSE